MDTADFHIKCLICGKYMHFTVDVPGTEYVTCLCGKTLLIITTTVTFGTNAVSDGTVTRYDRGELCPQ